MTFPEGIYDQLIDRKTRDLLLENPELRSIVKKIDSAESPARFAAFLSRIIEEALHRQETIETRRDLCNSIIDQLCGDDAVKYLVDRELTQIEDKDVLTEITPSALGSESLPRPVTPIWESSLFTGAKSDPRLDHELVQEIHSADRVDFLVAFIRWSGLRLLLPALTEAEKRGVPVRVITTSYMGASEAKAVERLAGMSNVQIRVSYDTDRTRLHAKAYHFHRESGFSTAYIGSANVSSPALTSGLEWNLKVTNQDLPHILEKFLAEFETYWNSPEFVPFDQAEPERFRKAIQTARDRRSGLSTAFFADITPHPFQERILEALQRERKAHGRFQNLVVAATGTGKTVVAAFDYARFRREAISKGKTARLLFVAHRKEILEQSCACFRAILRDQNFGELHVGPYQAATFEHLFCSNLSLGNLQLWDRLGSDYFDYIVIDEAHHGAASTYRDIFERFQSKILLGLTATPERMDGASLLPDFGGRFAAEIRLPDALEEKLLCPFHYFAVSDPVALSDDRFWRAGKYDKNTLENVYTGAEATAQQRVDAVIQALDTYHGDYHQARAVGFCVSVRHAEYMAECFEKIGIPSRALHGKSGDAIREKTVREFRDGKFPFLFVVDIFNEGVDIPDIDTVLFLRPTNSLTVFLQQLGRGLRHATEKDCLTVIDLVGQMHRRYRIDRKFAALLPERRFRVDREVAADFPHLPAGCSIHLEKQARRHVLENIKRHYSNLQVAVTESIKSFESEANLPLTFTNFVNESGYEAHQLLGKMTWSQWKSKAGIKDTQVIREPKVLRFGVTRTSLLKAPTFIETVNRFAKGGDPAKLTELEKTRVHYLLRQKSGKNSEFANVDESLKAAAEHTDILNDLREVSEWANDNAVPGNLEPNGFELHGTYTAVDINVVMGKATFLSPGQTGLGVVYFEKRKALVLLMTFQKSEKDFSPSTMYEDYPISRTRIHWQSQNDTTPDSTNGRRLTQHRDHGYTILIFARHMKSEFGVTLPFTFLGEASIVGFYGSRPITCQWDLQHPMPWKLYEQSRVGG